MCPDDQGLTCPICDEKRLANAPRKYMDDFIMSRYECQRCGTFDSDSIFENGIHANFTEARHLISAWVRQQNRAGIIPKFKGNAETSSPEWPESFKHMGFPESTSEKMNALLLAFADSAKSDYLHTLSITQPHLIAEVAAINKKEIEGLTEILRQIEYIQETFGGYQISAKGWLHIEELQMAVSTGNTAFVAMWFDDTTKAYSEAVVVAVKYCGYHAVIVNQEEYNGFIMDQVITLIREARFLIADFTCRPESPQENGEVKGGVRGGVYWESGMAYGMGKPVIHTCEKSDEAKSRIHFDVDQYNTISWNQDELSTEIRDWENISGDPSFAEKLVVRILTTVGRGNNAT